MGQTLMIMGILVRIISEVYHLPYPLLMHVSVTVPILTYASVRGAG